LVSPKGLVVIISKTALLPSRPRKIVLRSTATPKLKHRTSAHVKIIPLEPDLNASTVLTPLRERSQGELPIAENGRAFRRDI
jgi:hypothetical protein